MTDKEFILYLCKLLWNDLSDGDTPEEKDWDIVYRELESRSISAEEVFGY